MRQFSQWGAVALAAMFIVALGTTAFARAPVPEVSPASISTALTLLAGSVLVVRSRRGRK
jgi:hypothetical protein